MALTCEQWIDVSLSLSLVSIFCLSVISSLNIEAQPDSINVQNTIVTAPLTVVVPITADVQNAQVCVSAASSGDQSCTQVIVSPELNTYEAVHVDLSDPVSVPAVTTAAPGVSKTIAPGSKRTDDAASTNAHQPPVINIKNTVVTQPLTVMIPIETDAQTAQICVTVISSGSQSCQQVVLDPETGMYTPVNVDLSQSTPVITPQGTTASSPPNQPQSINVEHTEVTAPITVIVPITGDIQNAQICVSAGSSGTQSCTQLIVNSEQTAYTPVNADLTQSEAATVSNTVQQGPAPTSEPTTAATTARESEPDTPTVTDSQQVPASSATTPDTTVEPSATDNEQPSSDSKPREESAEQGEDNNSNTGETAPSDGEQESTNEDSSTEE
ncbi:MAG TPA: hypothetical protein VE573_15890 [Nitrososphaeraceae archaeon]|nr:hypothetical protein [Nitrososphaeraceae archaeon]